MIISENWLREWVSPRIDSAQLAARLTMAGLEVGAVRSAAIEPLHKVVVGEVQAVAPHPRADRLRVCTVNVARARPLRIVCGAPNVAAGIKVPTALIGARLLNGTVITKTRIRDVVSSGMLCSATELGLDDAAEGILVLDADAKPGKALRTHLALDDQLFEIELTPNRGDCLSLAGVAREVAALTDAKLTPPRLRTVRAQSKVRVSIRLAAPKDCPRYVGRVIENVDMTARTPDWMRERLRRLGVRTINPVVDVTNYVMLELGQPMHAFDLAGLDAGIVVRHGRKGETLTILDGTAVELDAATLIIADRRGPIALAGIMGGRDSGITLNTQSIVLESAFFRPGAVAMKARELGLHTDASHRFERGVDPAGQRVAMERATELLLQIADGTPGPLVHAINKSHLPKHKSVRLDYPHIERLLGTSVATRRVEKIMRRLGMTLRRGRGGWQVTPPSYRFDIAAEHDLIEEIARVNGYDTIPSRAPTVTVTHHGASESTVPDAKIRDTLFGRDYFEVITYSFVDPVLQGRLDPNAKPVALINPIAPNMAVMRTSLWAGLLQTTLNNLNRQHLRVRLFEVGNVFHGNNGGELACIGGIATGPAWPEQWAGLRREVDFFDVKADVEALLALTGKQKTFGFKRAQHPALHPGQTARIVDERKTVGWIGRLDPALQRDLDISQPVFVFEISGAAVRCGQRPQFAMVSRYPATGRDLAVVVDETVTADELLETIRETAGPYLKKLELFDVYRGEGIDSSRKSLAFSLTFQDISRTLKEEHIETIMARIRRVLQNKLGGELRS